MLLLWNYSSMMVRLGLAWLQLGVRETNCCCVDLTGVNITDAKFFDKSNN